MSSDKERVFDIFRKTTEGECVWVEAVKSVDEARSRVRRLQRVETLSHSEYMIFDTYTGRFLEKIKGKTA